MSGRKHSLRKSCRVWTTPTVHTKERQLLQVARREKRPTKSHSTQTFANIKVAQSGQNGAQSDGGLPRYRPDADAIELPSPGG